jgi:hypothetical protein
MVFESKPAAGQFGDEIRAMREAGSVNDFETT